MPLQFKMSKNRSKQKYNEHPLLLDAINCFKVGHFEGAIERCDRLKKISPKFEIVAAGVEWLSCVYSTRKEHHARAQRARYTKEILDSSGKGGPCVAEISWLYSDFWDGTKWKLPKGIESRTLGPFQQVLSFLENQHGVFVSFHSTAVLRLARLALKQSKLEIARRLTNCLLGWRTPVANGIDIEEFGRLLADTKAPVTLWSEWARFFFDHSQAKYSISQHAKKYVDGRDFSVWVTREYRESVNVLSRVIAIAPLEFPLVLRALIPYFAWNGFADMLADMVDRANRHKIERTNSDPKPHCETSWYSSENIKTRYFWYDMLKQHERNFVANGDWAMFCAPTDDHSMGLAQWWRLIESVFGRIVTTDLGKLYDSNPDWIEKDRKSLSERKARAESVFLEKLAQPEMRDKMTLSDILLVLEKCVVNPRVYKVGDSILRQKATEYFSSTSQRIRDSLHGYSSSNLSRSEHILLSSENIRWFRNRAAHVEPISLADACVGRLIAKRVVDIFFGPQLAEWGFQATLPIFEVGDSDKSRFDFSNL